MFLKNYTSDVPVPVTIARIEKVLVQCGVSGIAKEYGPTSEVSALTFFIQIGPQKVTVRLPVNGKACLDALWKDYVDGDKTNADDSAIMWNPRKRKSRKDFVEQADRTAWKITQDWVEVQMSMIQTKQADFVQVFMPYIWNGSQTFYQTIKEGGYKALLPESNQ